MTNFDHQIQCVILAGGLGTRMRAVTGDLPKSLLPAGDHPFLYYQFAALQRSGVTHVVLCLGHGAARIQDYLQTHAPEGLAVSTIVETEPLGTGGALRLALDHGALAEAFLVTYGDSYLPIDFSVVWRHFRTRPEPALMTVLRNDDRWDRSNACFDGTKVTLYDKTATAKLPGMRFIDYGLMAMTRALVEKEIQSLPFDLAALLNRLSRDGALAGYEVRERFYEIGSPSGWDDFRRYIETAMT